MIKNFEETKGQLAELATVLNSFKSEAVQLKIIELVFQDATDRAVVPSDSGGAEPPAKTRKRKAAVSKATAVSGGERVATEGAKSRRRAAGSGPFSTLGLLIQDGFFGKHQTIGQIVEHCVSSKARNFKPNEISGPLGRLVQDNKLKRKKNADGQFEYFV